MEQKRVAPYADAFRQQMVELVAAGRRPMELAREFGCSDGSIHAWVKKTGPIVDLPRGANALQAAQSARTNASRMALSTQERDELVKLRTRVKQLEIERDILSNATAWFAQKSEKTTMMSTES
jgi:transposase